MKFWTALLLALAMGGGISSPTHAKWYEASSDHFVIYADDSEKDIRRFAENLERYHSAMEFLTGRDLAKPSPSNRVTIFVVGNQREIRRLAGGNNRRVAGFYIPRASGSIAFVQDIRFKSGYPDFSTVILLHEYAHHFLMSSTPYGMPRWLNEGAAEFFAATTFKSDGGVLIGRPAQHRANDFAYADKVSVKELFDEELYEKNKGRRYDAFYAQSWLLYHYLTFTPERSGQLNAYQIALINGTPSPQAAAEAFGEIGKLQTNLRAYLRQRRMFTFDLTPDRISIGPVSLRELPRGEAEMMDVRIRSQRGVNREQAEELLIEAREIAAYYPNDPGAQTVLAEAEFDAGNNAEAIAAADRALAADPTRTNAHVQKGYALFRIAGDAETADQDAAFGRAMAAFSELNRLENDHPLPLIYYYRSYTERGKTPPENARHALERASQLAPFDHNLAMQAAFMQAMEGKIALATHTLKPVAANPHGGKRAEHAQNLITAMADATEGEAFRMPERAVPLVRVVVPDPDNGDEDSGAD
ncbi:hypothetical protein ACRAQ7_01095 [Erythrobacter sp. W53]|uniref:hypothetical protein n=1 Tax=Erythrobacter sp. W53 TaxID=3425947 RepID=UPI003D76A00C